MNAERRYDLDWLRIGLFLLLIFYHVGMFYVPWQWHVKSAHAPVEWLELPMRILNPWRIPALFIISGIALRFALDKSKGHWPFLRRRFVRLFFPVLFGMVVICAPQAYFELKEDGVDTGGFIPFYAGYISPPWASPASWTTITPTWNHLWYLVYVLLLSILIVVISASLKSRLETGMDRVVNYCSKKPFFLLLLPMIVSFFILWLFKESVGAVQIIWGDWHRLANSLWLMIFGFAIAKQAKAWTVFWRTRWWTLSCAVVLGLLLTMANLQWFWVGSSYDAHYYITRSFYSWAFMLSLLGFVHMLGRGPDKIRRYLSNAVFPYYVLHQTVIIVLGVWLGQFGFNVGIEGFLLIAGTGIICIVIHHFVVLNMGRYAMLMGGKV